MRLPWWLPIGTVQEIAASDLARDLAGPNPPLLLDVRTEAEFARGHIHGAVSAPIHALASRLDALGLRPGRPVVAICLSAHRSIPAVRLLRERGLEASQLAGGMFAWRAAGMPEEG
jgi:rhodanese-related sulfurtransferase